MTKKEELLVLINLEKDILLKNKLNWSDLLELQKKYNYVFNVNDYDYASLIAKLTSFKLFILENFHE